VVEVEVSALMDFPEETAVAVAAVATGRI